MKLLIILIFFSVSGWSKVIGHSVTLKRVEIFSLKEACQFLGHTDQLIVSKKDRSHLDCMGKYELVTDFCIKKFPNEKALTRGYIDKTSNQVVCERGQGVILKVLCDKRDLNLCKSPQKGCEKLKKIFAIRHEVFRSGLVDYSKGKALNCYYTIPENEKNSLQNLKDPIK